MLYTMLLHYMLRHENGVAEQVLSLRMQLLAKLNGTGDPFHNQ